MSSMNNSMSKGHNKLILSVNPEIENLNVKDSYKPPFLDKNENVDEDLNKSG